MNKLITYSAKAKLQAMIEAMPGTIAMRVTQPPKGSFRIQYLFSKDRDDDIIIASSPYVVTDLFTMSTLTDASIDFSYPDGEFIIKRDTNVFPSYA